MFTTDFSFRHCKTCLSIDYKEAKPRVWVPRTKTEERQNFILQGIPTNLQAKILQKMEQKSFSRMRRTNKRMSAFIEETREKLKIALFHNWEITFEAKHRLRQDGSLRNDDYVVFHAPSTVIYEKYQDRLQGLEIEVRDEPVPEIVDNRFQEFTGLVRKEVTTEFAYYDPDENQMIFNNPHVTISISLTAWETNAALRRELIGNYNASVIKFDTWHPSDEVMEIMGEFMQWAGMIGRRLKVTNMRASTLKTLCKWAKPTGLYIADKRGYDRDLLEHEAFSEVDELVFSHVCEIPHVKYQLAKLKAFHADSCDEQSLSDLNVILRHWCTGKCPIEEMMCNGEGPLSMEGSKHRRLEPNEAREILRAQMDEDDRNHAIFVTTTTGVQLVYHENSWVVYLLECDLLKKQALVFFTNDYFYFRALPFQ